MKRNGMKTGKLIAVILVLALMLVFGIAEAFAQEPEGNGVKLFYDANGATSGTAPSNSDYVSGRTATVSGNTGNLGKTDFVFAGWNTRADGKGTPYDANDTFTISTNTTLYAMWTHTHGSGDSAITFYAWTDAAAQTQYAGHSYEPTGGGKASNCLPTVSGNYCLNENVTLSDPWIVPSGTTNLCLNGKIITTNFPIEVRSGNNLNIYDEHTGDAAGSIVYAGSNSNNLLRVNGAFSLYGGMITATENKCVYLICVYLGGTVCIEDGILKAPEIQYDIFIYSGGNVTMNGGMVTGGNVGVNVDGTFTMNGGLISQCGVRGVYVCNEKFFYLNGGTITGNSTGIVLAEEDYYNAGGKLILSGAPSVTGNTKANVAMGKGCVIAINNDGISLPEGATTPQIGVTMRQDHGPGVFTEGWAEKMTSEGVIADPAEYFSSDNSDYVIALTKDGKEVQAAIPAAKPEITALTGLTGDNALTYGYADAEGSIAVEAGAAEGHTLSYQWYSCESDGSGGAAIDATKESSAATASYTIPTGKDAGTYYYYCDITATREEGGLSATVTSDVVSVTVNKAAVTEPTIDSKVYNAQAQTATIAESKLYTVTKNAGGTSVGEYDVVLTLADADNYKWSTTAETAVTLKFEITQASAPTITTPTPKAVTYDPAGTLADVKLPEGWAWSSPTTMPTVVNNGYEATIAVDDINYKFTKETEGYNATTHKVTRTVTLTVNPAASTPATVAPNNRTYDGTEKPLLTVTGDPIGGKMKYALGEDATTKPAESAFAESIPEKKDVGTYTVWHMVDGDDNHEDIAPAKVNVAITPKSITGASVTLDVTQLSYTGAQQSVKVTGVALDSLTLTEADYTISGDVSGPDKGEYTVTVTGKGNFCDSASATWSIVEKAMKVSVENVNVTYDGKAYGITANVTDPIEGATVTYGLSETACDQKTSPTLTDAGTLTVYYKATAANYNDYTGKAIVNIGKADVTVTAEAKAKVYGDNDPELTATVTGAIGQDKLAYTLARTAGENAGEYAIAVTAGENKNYNVTAKNSTFTITKADAEVTAMPTYRILFYTGDVQELVDAGTATGGGMQYALGKNTAIVPTEGWSKAIPTGTEAGDYFIWYRAAGNINYNESQARVLHVTISAPKQEDTASSETEFVDNSEYSGVKGVDTKAVSAQLDEIAKLDGTPVGENQIKDVNVKLEMKAVEANNIVEAERGSIQTAAGKFISEEKQKSSVLIDFLQITVKKDVSVYDVDSKGKRTETRNIKEELDILDRVIDVPVNYDMTGKHNPVVVRYHKGMMLTFMRLDIMPSDEQVWKDGTFYVEGSGRNAVIHIYTNRFSTYAVLTLSDEEEELLNGLYNIEGTRWVLMKNGEIDVDYTGLYNDAVYGLWFVRNGEIDWAFTGLYNDSVYGWQLIHEGTVCRWYNGLFYDQNYGWWLVQNGAVAFGYNGLWNDPNFGWWLIKDGTVDFSYTGLHYEEQYGWWLIHEGAIAAEYNGFYYDMTYGWWLIRGGTIAREYNGLCYDMNYGWWLIKDGTIDFSYNGLVYDPNCGWWLISGGRVDFDYTGLHYEDEYGWWLIHEGALAVDYNGFYCDATYGWWLIRKGTIAFDYNGLCYDMNCGWWLIKNGAVDSGYNGLYDDTECGRWLIKGGTVDFSYSGEYNDPKIGWCFIKEGKYDWDYVYTE